MTPYIMRMASPEVLDLFKHISLVVSRMPDVDLGEDRRGQSIPASCHMVTRALARFFPVEVRDGYVPRGCVHSWLVPQPVKYRAREDIAAYERQVAFDELIADEDWVIDPYPWDAIGGPIMVPAYNRTSAWWDFYQREQCFLEHREEPFLFRVALVQEAVAVAIQGLRAEGFFLCLS